MSPASNSLGGAVRGGLCPTCTSSLTPHSEPPPGPPPDKHTETPRLGPPRRVGRGALHTVRRAPRTYSSAAGPALGAAEAARVDSVSPSSAGHFRRLTSAPGNAAVHQSRCILSLLRDIASAGAVWPPACGMEDTLGLGGGASRNPAKCARPDPVAEGLFRDGMPQRCCPSYGG